MQIMGAFQAAEVTPLANSRPMKTWELPGENHTTHSLPGKSNTGGRLVDDLVELPLVFELEAENGTGRGCELSMPDAHQNREAVLEALVVDPDANLGFHGFREGIGILDGPCLQNLQRKCPTHLSVGVGRDNLDVVAKLKVAAFLGQPAQRSTVSHGSDGPEVVLGSALDLCRIQNDLFPIQPDRTRFQEAVGVKPVAPAARQRDTRGQ